MPLSNDVLTYRITKEGKVLIAWRGRVVTTLASMQADRLREGVYGPDTQSVQLLLARVTGNFKRGNERTA